MCVNYERGKCDEMPMDKGIDGCWSQMLDTNRIVTFGYIRITFDWLLKPSKRLKVTSTYKCRLFFPKYKGKQPYFFASNGLSS